MKKHISKAISALKKVRTSNIPTQLDLGHFTIHLTPQKDGIVDITRNPSANILTSKQREPGFSSPERSSALSVINEKLGLDNANFPITGLPPKQLARAIEALASMHVNKSAWTRQESATQIG